MYIGVLSYNVTAVKVQHGEEVSDEPEQTRICAIHETRECDLLVVEGRVEVKGR